MHYCKSCRNVFPEDVCPNCGKKGNREAVAADWCFLVKKQEMWAGMLSDVLTQNKIPFQTEDELESWLTECRRKAPRFSHGDVRRLLHDYLSYEYMIDCLIS